MGYTRSASDVLRLLVYGTLAVILLLVTRYAEDAVLGFEQDVVAALGFLEPPAERILEGVAELVAAVAGIIGVSCSRSCCGATGCFGTSSPRTSCPAS